MKISRYKFEYRENDQLVDPWRKNLWLRNMEQSRNPIPEILGSFAIAIITISAMIYVAWQVL